MICPPLHYQGVGSIDRADIFVTNALPGSVHILTAGLPASPLALHPVARRAGALDVSRADEWCLRPSFEFIPSERRRRLHGRRIRTGGASLTVVIDTGAAAASLRGRPPSPPTADVRADGPPRREWGSTASASAPTSCAPRGPRGARRGRGRARSLPTTRTSRARMGTWGWDSSDASTCGSNRARSGLRASGLPAHDSGATRDGRCDQARFQEFPVPPLVIKVVHLSFFRGNGRGAPRTRERFKSERVYARRASASSPSRTHRTHRRLVFRSRARTHRPPTRPDLERDRPTRAAGPPLAHRAQPAACNIERAQTERGGTPHYAISAPTTTPAGSTARSPLPLRRSPPSLPCHRRVRTMPVRPFPRRLPGVPRRVCPYPSSSSRGSRQLGDDRPSANVVQSSSSSSSSMVSVDGRLRF